MAERFLLKYILKGWFYGLAHVQDGNISPLDFIFYGNNQKAEFGGIFSLTEVLMSCKNFAIPSKHHLIPLFMNQSDANS